MKKQNKKKNTLYHISRCNTGLNLTVQCLSFVWDQLQVTPLIQKVDAHYRILVLTYVAYMDTRRYL